MTRRKSAEKTYIANARIEMIEVTPAVSTSPAYTANDAVGGVQTVAVATRGDLMSSELIGITIIDVGGQEPDLTISFYDETPTGTVTDNTALVISDAEMVDKCLGHIKVATADYDALSTGQSIYSLKDVKIPIYTQTDGTVYMVIQTTGTPTFTSVSDLTFKLFFRHGA